MQSVIPDNRLQAVRIRPLEEIKATKKRIHRDLHPLFNLTMQNKIDHANRILGLMDRYPNMTVKELLFLIESRIEGEKFVNGKHVGTTMTDTFKDIKDKILDIVSFDKNKEDKEIGDAGGEKIPLLGDGTEIV